MAHFLILITHRNERYIQIVTCYWRIPVRSDPDNYNASSKFYADTGQDLPSKR
jgi:hypothetical protein